MVLICNVDLVVLADKVELVDIVRIAHYYVDEPTNQQISLALIQQTPIVVKNSIIQRLAHALSKKLILVVFRNLYLIRLCEL